MEKSAHIVVKELIDLAHVDRVRVATSSRYGTTRDRDGRSSRSLVYISIEQIQRGAGSDGELDEPRRGSEIENHERGKIGSSHTAGSNPRHQQTHGPSVAVEPFPYDSESGLIFRVARLRSARKRSAKRREWRCGAQRSTIGGQLASSCEPQDHDREHKCCVGDPVVCTAG